jgi:RNA polymerase sigma-70 factor, ECF subfamily
MNTNFESIYRAHAEAIFRYALRLAGNRELAEDITSEVFLEVYRNQDFIQEERLPAWLYTVARNRAVDHWRKRASERRYVESLKEPVTSPEGEVELQTWLAGEPSLKPLHRVCLTLHFVHGMTRSEIAKRLALSEIKVKGHLQYALQLLRKAWDCANTGGPCGAR